MKKYILKDDLPLSQKEQTIWHLNELDAKSAITHIKKQIEDDKDLYLDEWLAYIAKVENYQFGSQYIRLKNEGYISFDDKETIEKCLTDLDIKYVREILEQAKGISHLDILLKKKLEFATFYYRWKCDKFERQRLTDCRTCIHNKWIEKQGRVCYLMEREFEIPFPTFQIMEGSTIARRVEGEDQIVWAEVDDIYVWLIESEEYFPETPSLEILRLYLKPICPESLIDPLCSQYFRMESAVKAYGTKAMDLSFWMFETFEIIRAAESRWENIQNFKREAEFKSKNKRGN